MTSVRPSITSPSERERPERCAFVLSAKKASTPARPTRSRLPKSVGAPMTGLLSTFTSLAWMIRPALQASRIAMVCGAEWVTRIGVMSNCPVRVVRFG